MFSTLAKISLKIREENIRQITDDDVREIYYYSNYSHIYKFLILHSKFVLHMHNQQLIDLISNRAIRLRLISFPGKIPFSKSNAQTFLSSSERLIFQHSNSYSLNSKKLCGKKIREWMSKPENDSEERKQLRQNIYHLLPPPSLWLLPEINSLWLVAGASIKCEVPLRID